jgi:[protein-PII] uridylyltransferase
MAGSEDLAGALERLLGEPLRAGQPRLLNAAELRDALVDLYEFWLTKSASSAGIGGLELDGADTNQPGMNKARPKVALVAVGGLGRGELVPYSDLDLVLLHDGGFDEAAITAIAEALWYPLWNARVGLDHSVRTISQARTVATEDSRTALALLDARHLYGSTELTSELLDVITEQWRRTAKKRLDSLAAGMRARWEHGGEIAQAAEPDLKHGRGGLRDWGILDALAKAQLIDKPGEELLEVKRLLLDVRTELRRQTRRGRDVLTAVEAERVARELGFTDRFELARALSSGARKVNHAVTTAFRSTMDTPRMIFGRRPPRVPLSQGVVRHGDEVALAAGADCVRDAGLLLRVAAASAKARLPISFGTLRTLAESAPELHHPWPEDALDSLIDLLSAGPGLIDVVEALDQNGLWSRLFPEWGAVRDLPSRSPIHSWTVDRHLLATCVAAAELRTEVSRPDLLVLSAFLHDIGKGRNSDHSILGEEIARQVVLRMGLSSQDAELVAQSVRHHLLLPHTATRRDIGDPATISRVVDTVGNSPIQLELLSALSQADSVATGPGVWSAWKASLVHELVARCQTVMRGRRPELPDRVDARQAELVKLAVSSGHGELVLSAQGKLSRIVVAAPLGVELLTPTAGVLAMNSLDVHSAEISQNSEGTVGIFLASPRFGSPPNVALLREQFSRATSTDWNLSAALTAKEAAYPLVGTEFPDPRISWFDSEASGDTTAVFEVRATDRMGLLYRIADALRDCSASVGWAKVNTLGGTVIDSFSVTAPPGRLDASWKSVVEKAVLRAASSTASVESAK